MPTDIQEIVSSIDDLPTTAQILPRLQRLLRDEETDIASLAALVKMDLGLATEIVKISNSALYGGGEARGLEDAINRLGFDLVYKITSTVAAKSTLSGSLPFYSLASGCLWNQSLATAILMENVAMRTDLNADTAYTIGLLHAIGKLVINAHFTQRGLEVYGETDETPTPEMERQLLGWDHAQVGALVLHVWKFPMDVREPIEFQFAPQEAPESRMAATMLQLCRDAVLRTNYFTDPADAPAEECLGQIGLLPHDWEEAEEDARLALESMTSAFVS